MKKKRRRLEDELMAAIPRAGTRMLIIPASPADPMRLAEESMEELKREQPPRPVKTFKGKRRKASR